MIIMFERIKDQPGTNGVTFEMFGMNHVCP